MQLLLADDHTLFRDALVYYIERHAPEIKVRVAPDLHGAIEILEGQSGQTRGIDLVMLDLRMPGMNGLQGLEKMRRLFPQQNVAVVSGVAEARDVAEAAALGASGYFPKTLAGQAMLAGIRQVMAGQPFFAQDYNTGGLLPAYFRDSFRPAHEPPGETGAALTPREKQVLGLLAEGLSNKQIAEKLSLQVVTIKLHVRSVCRKLGAANRTQAALLARDHNL